MNHNRTDFEIYTVTFFGHRHIERLNQTMERLESLLRHIIDEHKYVEFLVGRDGDFDQAVSSTIHRLKRNYRSDNSSHIWVMPYMTAEYTENQKCYDEYYDEVEICEESAAAHFKAAYLIRNKYMADRAELVICMIDHASGGAYSAVSYAKKLGKKIINLGELPYGE